MNRRKNSIVSFAPKAINKGLLVSSLIISATITTFAQDTTRLREYLEQHRYTIDIASSHAFDMLPGLMKGKNLFVLGEGGSHGLEFYTTLKPALLDQLDKQNLKSYFIEYGRSAAFFMNNYLNNETNDCIHFYENHCKILDHEKATIAKGHKFKITGIDFERPMTLNYSIRFLFQNEDLDKLPHSKPLISKLLDSSYKANDKGYKSSVRAFQRFYKHLKNELYQDSAAIRRESGYKYAALEYMITNPNNTYPWIDRNKAMARNLIHEIIPIDTTAVYFLSIGMAHSLPNENYSTVHKLCKNEMLKDKILVMNLFCENCSVNGEPISGRNPIRFMRNEDIANCFSNAATTEVVLFDLSQLPPEYSYMNKYGDLLLYVKNQH